MLYYELIKITYFSIKQAVRMYVNTYFKLIFVPKLKNTLTLLIMQTKLHV